MDGIHILSVVANLDITFCSCDIDITGCRCDLLGDVDTATTFFVFAGRNGD